MSLILEALKKLDREKQTPERGVLVLGATAWAARSEGRARLWRFLLADLLLVAIGGGLVWLWLRPHGGPVPPAAAPAPAAARPSPAPATNAPALLPLPPQDPAPLPSVQPRLPRAVASAPAEPSPAPSVQAKFVLQAVTEQDGQPVALIDERLLRVGEGFDGMRVLSITATEVEIEIEATHERRTLSF